jgi:SAM-dependent methyltransferase
VASYGRGLLNSLTGTPQYLSWLTRVLRPHLGDTVFEAGAGLGNLTGRLMAKKLEYVAGEKDPLYLHALRNRFLRTPSVRVCKLDPEDPADYEPWKDHFESALCVNLLETVDDPSAVILQMAGILKPGGTAIVLAPQGQGLYGSLDKALGHKRRFSSDDLRQMMQQAGLRVDRVYQMNKIGRVSWFVFGKLLGRKRINKFSLKVFDKTVWFWRRIDGLLPWKGLSVIVVASKIQ